MKEYVAKAKLSKQSCLPLGKLHRKNHPFFWSLSNLSPLLQHANCATFSPFKKCQNKKEPNPFGHWVLPLYTNLDSGPCPKFGQCPKERVSFLGDLPL